MPEVSYATVVAAPVERVWNYVEDLNRWRHLMVGYQALEIVDDRRSIWTLRGDVGILSREVKIQVDITEWITNERVSFVVTGLTERLDGAGSFLLERVATSNAAGDGGARDDGAGVGRVPGVPAAAGEPRLREPRLLRRLRFAIARAILRRLRRKAGQNRALAEGRPAGQISVVADRGANPAAPVTDNAASPPGEAGDGSPSSRLTFELRVSPLGPMAPMLELLMAPMLEPAAQDLADGIRLAVES